MKQAYSAINQTLVTLFNHIMRIEEQALTLENLSIREIHVIEAVCDATEESRNAMTDVAGRLGITPGSLSVAVRTLTGKGYLQRVRDDADKRITRVMPTEAALAANRQHQLFHHQMTDAIIGDMNHHELSVLVQALSKVNAYFMQKENEK